MKIIKTKLNHKYNITDNGQNIKFLRDNLYRITIAEEKNSYTILRPIDEDMTYGNWLKVRFKVMYNDL